MYAPLKVTTDYTLLKSLIKIDSLMSFLVKHEINACGICDENLSGSIDFYNKCLSNNIKPIIGLSVFINNLNIYLYAMNYQGYKNLIKINTIKETRELSFSDLEEYKDNILAIIPYKSINLYEALSFYKYRFISYINEYEKSNSLIITKNILYVEDLRCLDINDIKYMMYLDKLRKDNLIDYSNNYYQELEIINENEINRVIDLIDIKMPTGNKYIPKYRDDVDSYKFLMELANKGLKKRLNNKVTNEYQNRLDYELSIINKMGFVDYFLIVYDYVLFAKKNNILVGPGRGSAAGSLVSYSIGITDIDPLKYNLMFERFLNPERITMPDIDIDFDATKRDEVLKYVQGKYGEKNVALGLTYSTLKSKLVLREIAKLEHVNSGLIDKFVGSINPSLSLKDNLDNPNVLKFIETYKELKKIYNISIHLENIKRNISTHAAGVVLSSVSLDEVIPVHYNNNFLQTGITMDYLENIGLLKMDFLGLKNLTTIANITKNIPGFNINNIDLNDHKVYELFSSGKTEGIFQFETPALKQLSLKLKPRCFNDLIVAIALDRPGPKDHIDEFINRHNNNEPVVYIDNSLQDILKETEGILVYQEQIMAILVKVANYSLAEADLVRRAISKKKESIIKDEETKFISRAVNNGYGEDIAKKIYETIAKFASYGFNKSHSVAYAIVAYELAYLKTYYPALFVIELLNDSKDIKKNNTYLTYLKSKCIRLIKPSINDSLNDYYLNNNSLIMPLWTIKGLNKDIANTIISNRINRYEDYFDFICRNKDILNDSIFKILVSSGVLDEFNINHQTMINNLESALNYAELKDDDGLISKPTIVEYPEYNDDILRIEEINSFGFYINNHPASIYNGKDIIKLNNISKYLFKKIKCVVLIDRISKIKTKNNEDMAFITGSDETSISEFTLFPRNFELINNINNGDLVEIYGEVSKRFDKVQIIINNIKKLGDK